MPFDPNQPFEKVVSATPAFNPARPVQKLGGETAAPVNDIEEPGLLSQVFENTRRVIGGAAADAAENAINFPADASNALVTILTQGQVDAPFKRPPDVVPDVEQPDNLPGELLRGVLPLAVGATGASQLVPKATKAGAEITAGTRGLLGGSAADVVLSDPEGGNLSNLIIELSDGDEEFAKSVMGGLAKNPKDPPFVNRLKDAFEGGGLGALGEKGLEIIFRGAKSARKAKPDASEKEIADAAIDELLVDQDAAQILRANGIDPAAPENAEFVGQALERIEARRAGEAARNAEPRDADLVELQRQDAEIEAGDVDPGFRATEGAAPRDTPADVIEVNPRGEADAGNVGTQAGVARTGEIKAKTQEEAREAFAIADARRQRVETDVETKVRQDVDTPRTADPRAAGRSEGRGANEDFVFVDATVRNGQMESGRQAEIAGSVEIDGNEFFGVRYADDGELAFVERDRVSSFGRPAQPRMAQEFEAASQAPPRGAGVDSTAGPRKVTDRVQSRTVAGLRGETTPPEAGTTPPPKSPDGEPLSREAEDVSFSEDASVRQAEADRSDQPRPQDTPEGPAVRQVEDPPTAGRAARSADEADDPFVPDKENTARAAEEGDNTDGSTRPRPEPENGSADAAGTRNDDPSGTGGAARAQARLKPDEATVTDSGPKQMDFNDVLDDAVDPKLRAAASRVRSGANTLYSNPFADISGIAKIGRDMLGWSAREGDRFVKQWQRINHLKESVPKSKQSALGQFGRMLLWSNDGQFRALGRVHKSDAINDVADMFHARAGEARGASRTFDEEVSTHLNTRKNQFAKIIGEDWLDDVAKMKQLRNILASEKPIKGTSRMAEVARGVRKLLDDELQYLRDAGVEVGEVPKGYFPRQPDIAAISQNPSGFIDKASRVYRRMGLSAKEAKTAAQEWQERILFEEASGGGKLSTPYGGVPNADFMQGRVFPKEADQILSDFLLTDTPDVLASYFSRAGRRAAWVRRFGAKNEKWDEIVERLRADGAEEAIPDLIKNIQVAAGTHAWGVSQRVRNGIGWARLWNTLGLLERATLTSISEIAMPAIRSGRPHELFKSIGFTVSDLVKGRKGDARQMAEDLGLIVNGLHDSLMAGRFATLDPDSRLQAQIMDAYFRRTGLEQFTRATRVASMRLGQTFIRRIAADATSGNKSGSIYLKELGVAADEIDEFSKWVGSKNNGLPETGDLLADEGMARAYRTALTRFMDQSVMRPGASTRPNWASHPIGGLVFQLQSFIYAFQKNVLNRTGRLAKQALTDKSLSMSDRAELLAPAAGLPMLVAIQMGVGEARDRAFASKEWNEKRDGWDRVGTAISRSGLTGVTDGLINMYSGVRYNKSPAEVAIGPLFGRVAKGIEGGIEAVNNNSENTNTAERNVAIAAYDLVFEPALNTMLSMYAPPGASQLGAAAITQGIGSKRTRDEIVSWIAGEKDMQSGPKNRSSERSGGGRNSRASSR